MNWTEDQLAELLQRRGVPSSTSQADVSKPLDNLPIILHLPYPPSTNRLWVRTKRGMRRSDEYMAWINDATNMAMQQRPGQLRGKYKLRIHAVRPDKRKRDLGNLEKSVSDFLQRISVIEDDCLAEMISARWVTAGQGITVIVEPAAVE